MSPTYHPRTAWQDPAKPVTGPAANWSNITTAVVHYTAADDLIDGDPGEHADDLPAYLRAMQASYLRTRGYSLGYMFAVDWLGGVWQIRGWEFQSAANKGHNGYTLPILLLVDGADPATPEAVRAVRWLIAEGGKRAGRDLAIKGHGQLYAETGIGTPTACPGVGLQAQVNAGVFSPQPDPPDPVPPTEGDEDMAKIAYYLLPPENYPAGSPEFVVIDASIRYRTNGDVPGLLPDVRVPAAQYDNLRKSAGL